jgi:transcriptional regulator GlxA family with amidase domain
MFGHALVQIRQELSGLCHCLRMNHAPRIRSAGLSSGIDLPLRVVERYFGTDVAKQTAYYMKYLGDRWKNPGANSIYV